MRLRRVCSEGSLEFEPRPDQRVRLRHARAREPTWSPGARPHLTDSQAGGITVSPYVSVAPPPPPHPPSGVLSGHTPGLPPIHSRCMYPYSHSRQPPLGAMATGYAPPRHPPLLHVLSVCLPAFCLRASGGSLRCVPGGGWGARLGGVWCGVPTGD